jgi:hypothetical protein
VSGRKVRMRIGFTPVLAQEGPDARPRTAGAIVYDEDGAR